MRFYADEMIFRMLHRATKSSLTSTKEMVHDIFMKETAHYLDPSEICQFSAQLEDIKWLAETEQYSQAKKGYWELTCRFLHNK
jgi:uncharacterized protein YciU (UPF0263 family)